MIADKSVSDAIYSLYGIVHHHGVLNGGHYIAFIIIIIFIFIIFIIIIPY